jgi:hypothetical protein
VVSGYMMIGYDYKSNERLVDEIGVDDQKNLRNVCTYDIRISSGSTAVRSLVRVSVHMCVPMSGVYTDIHTYDSSTTQHGGSTSSTTSTHNRMRGDLSNLVAQPVRLHTSAPENSGLAVAQQCNATSVEHQWQHSDGPA